MYSFTWVSHFLAGFLTRLILVRAKGKEWYYKNFVAQDQPPNVDRPPIYHYCHVQPERQPDSANPGDVVRIAIPLLIYFVVMFLISFWIGHRVGADYPKTTSLSFAAASNNFELAIAVAVAVFGISSGAAFAAVIGPLVEVPVMIGLVNVAFYLKKRMYAGTVAPAAE